MEIEGIIMAAFLLGAVICFLVMSFINPSIYDDHGIAYVGMLLGVLVGVIAFMVVPKFIDQYTTSSRDTTPAPQVIQTDFKFETVEASEQEIAEYKEDLLQRLDPDSKYFDVWLLARTAARLDRDGDILTDERASNYEALAYAAQCHFVEDRDYARKCFEALKPKIDDASIAIQSVTSAQKPQYP